MRSAKRPDFDGFEQIPTASEPGSEITRRSAQETTHVVCQMAGVREACLNRDLAYRLCSLSQKGLGSIHASPGDVLMHGLSDGCSE
jgi:hypothetical protein